MTIPPVPHDRFDMNTVIDALRWLADRGPEMRREVALTLQGHDVEYCPVCDGEYESIGYSNRSVPIEG